MGNGRLLHHLKKLTTLIGEAGRLKAATLVTHDAEIELDAHTVIKSVGFELNEGNEKLIGRTHMRSIGTFEH